MTEGNDLVGAGRLVWSVSALLLAANDQLQARFGACAVRGELSGFTRAGSGHCYFTLKDPEGGGSLRCAMFRRAAGLLDFAPRDGLQVQLRGRIAVYEARGELQLVVEAMQRVGAGTLYEEFLRLKARLEAQGVFDPARKRPLPLHPRRVGVVTSLGAAALRDVLTTLARRVPHVEVVVYPSLVQGAEAPAALVDALALAAARAEAEVLILCRGGGSLEDLWAFNDERLVRAVAASPLPVVCGVGHESDVTLADLAADLRAPTPTAAAELVSAASAELEDALAGLQWRLQRAVQRQLEGRAMRLDQLSLRFLRPAQALARHAHALRAQDERRRTALATALRLQQRSQQELAGRLLRGGRSQQRRASAWLDALQARLEALDPSRVLARGYAWVTDAGGLPLVSAQQVQPGQTLQAVWADGQATAQVLDVQVAPSAGHRTGR
ncbi:exodeoxyribonuclease VII large subunit [Ideonella sp. BN130291]|uniref:exodeoxyribonuclease VII large subunit n=1 Tax=Ideonella sp. BN130291 TaxID=3112940 RepID=UPI002E25FBA4|nr:exodeoxyribonuclease VII large subunit [Ideonella sp. BN130291]